MFFIYHTNIVALFFVTLFYRQDKFLIGLPLFFGYCISIIVLFFLNGSIQSYVKIFSVLYDFGMSLMFISCVFVSVKKFKRWHKTLNIQNLFIGFSLGFFIFIVSVLASMALLYVLYLLFSSYKAYLHFLVIVSLVLGLFLLYYFSQSMYMLWGKMKGYKQEKVYSMVFLIGSIALVLNFLPYVVEFFKRI